MHRMFTTGELQPAKPQNPVNPVNPVKQKPKGTGLGDQGSAEWFDRDAELVRLRRARSHWFYWFCSFDWLNWLSVKYPLLQTKRGKLSAPAVCVLKD